MKKANPLFVDSTKMRGDTILTTVELFGLKTQFGSSAFVRIRDDHADREKVFHLEPQEDGSHRAQIFLQHQTEIRYQFFVARDEVVLATGPLETTVAGHVLSANWVSAEIGGEFSEPEPELASEPLTLTADETAYLRERLIGVALDRVISLNEPQSASPEEQVSSPGEVEA